MKTITLTQPWASLVATGAKQIETRSWNTGYRGPLAIHAAKGIPRSAYEWAFDMAGILTKRGIDWKLEALPRGMVLATCRLVDVVPTTSVQPSLVEDLFGDFSPGRFAWLLADVQPLAVPILARGSLGLWEWGGESAVQSLK